MKTKKGTWLPLLIVMAIILILANRCEPDDETSGILINEDASNYAFVTENPQA